MEHRCTEIESLIEWRYHGEMHCLCIVQAAGGGLPMYKWQSTRLCGQGAYRLALELGEPHGTDEAFAPHSKGY